jgi:hypothetical protein
MLRLQLGRLFLSKRDPGLRGDTGVKAPTHYYGRRRLFLSQADPDQDFSITHRWSPVWSPPVWSLTPSGLDTIRLLDELTGCRQQSDATSAWSEPHRSFGGWLSRRQADPGWFIGNNDPDFPPPLPNNTGMQFISDPLLFDPPPPPLVPFLTWVQQHRDGLGDRLMEFAERFALDCRRAWWRPCLRLVRMRRPNGLGREDVFDTTCDESWRRTELVTRFTGLLDDVLKFRNGDS